MAIFKTRSVPDNKNPLIQEYRGILTLHVYARSPRFFPGSIHLSV